MQKQINQQVEENKTQNSRSTNSPGSWSQLFNKYIRIINTKRKTENFVEKVTSQVLIAMFPAILIKLFSLTSFGVNAYTFTFILFVSMGLLYSTSYETSSLMNIHIGALYMILPTIFVLFSPIFYGACAILGVINVIERFN